MGTLVHLVVCREVVVDQASNNVSLHNVIEDLQIPKEMMKQPDGRLHLVQIPLTVYALFWWEWPDHETPHPFDLELQLLSPSGTVLAKTEAHLDPGSNKRYRALFNFEVFPLDGVGTYTFQLLIDGEIKGRTPLSIQAQESSGEVASAEPASDGQVLPKKASTKKASTKKAPTKKGSK